MPLPKRPPALHIDEWRALGRACKQMDALAAMLHASGWNGKGVALVELSQAYEVIAGIYNRTEAAILGNALPPSKRTLKSALAEAVAKDQSAGAPEAVPGQEEA